MVFTGEMTKTEEAAGMSLGQVRQQMARTRRGERIEAEELGRLHEKLKMILRRLGGVSSRGGRFAKIQASDEMLELYERSRW